MEKKRIYIMIEITKRELEARLYFAFIASLHGYSVVIAKKGQIWYRRNLLKPGIVIFKSIGPMNTKMIDDIKKAGHEIVAWDEEAFVTPKKLNFFVKRRIKEYNLNKVNYFFSWGGIEHNYLSKEFPEFKNKFKITGNSRVDVLKGKFSSVFDPEVKKIKDEFGKFTLFLGNFGHINPAFYTKGVTTKDRRVELGNLKKDTEEYKWVVKQEKLLIDTFSILPYFFNQFSKNFPDKKLIIRPHPSENIENYLKMIKGLKNIYLIQDNKNALSWIKASDLMISSNCTTSVEAYLLNKNKKNINLFLSNDQEQEYYLPPKVSINVGSIQETIKILKKIYGNSILNENIKKKLNDIEGHLNMALYNYKSEICSVKEMIKYFENIELKKNIKDKKVNKFYFYYFFLRSLIGQLKQKFLFIFKSKKEKNYIIYMKQKMAGFNFKEISSKFKIISHSGGKNIKDFKIKELIPSIFCIEKKD